MMKLNIKNSPIGEYYKADGDVVVNRSSQTFEANAHNIEMKAEDCKFDGSHLGSGQMNLMQQGESSSSTRSEDLEAAVLEILKFDITTEQLEKCLSNGYTIQDMKMQLLQNKTNKKRIDKLIDSMTKTQKD